MVLKSRLDRRELREDAWKEWLGEKMFGLPLKQAEKYRPQFRSLISYFARRGKDAYTLPTEHHRKQSVADVQVHNSFLLGLESQDAMDFQKLKDKREALRQFRRITEGSAAVEEAMGSRGELEALKVRLEGQARAEEQQLAGFRVHPQYEDIANQANRLTEEIHGLVNQNVVDKRLLELYEKSSQEEVEAGSDQDVALVYQEAGVVLPGVVKRRLEDVATFNRTLLENRRAFLQEEMQRLHADIAGRTAQIEARTAERAAHMDILRTHGALEEYSGLQRRHAASAAGFDRTGGTEDPGDRLIQCLLRGAVSCAGDAGD
ncbi:MAG: hypothetical protein SFV51_24215 [Bryobacteraceae bacterium]|nr:hypothetical protein [Bryobacteraceae bacterium]